MYWLMTGIDSPPYGDNLTYSSLILITFLTHKYDIHLALNDMIPYQIVQKWAVHAGATQRRASGLVV